MISYMDLFAFLNGYTNSLLREMQIIWIHLYGYIHILKAFKFRCIVSSSIYILHPDPILGCKVEILNTLDELRIYFNTDIICLKHFNT